MNNVPTFRDLDALAQVAGTPFYLFDEARLTEQALRLDRIAEHHKGFAAYFMAKANFSSPVLERLARHGVGVVVTSFLELNVAVRAGFEGSRLLAVGPAKTPEFLEACRASSILTYTVEGPEDAELIAGTTGGDISVLLRVRPHVRAHRGVSWFGGTEGADKFGVDLCDAARAVTKIGELRGVRLVGLAANLGSQICDANVFEAGLRQLIRVGRQLRGLPSGNHLKIINIGGGLPVANLRRCHEGAISNVLRSMTGRSWGDSYEIPPPECEPEFLVPRLHSIAADCGFLLWMEPGRWLSAGCMTLVARVVRVQEHSDCVWLYVDGGIDSFPDVGFGDRRPIFAVCRQTESSKVRTHTVAGPLCMKADVFARSVPLPQGIAAGDYILLGEAGAYGFSRASWFGGRLPAIAALTPEPRILWKAADVGQLFRNAAAEAA